MKDQLTIKNNQRHKFSNFRAPWTLKSYCETHRIASDSVWFLKDAGNIFLFKTCSEKAITCILLSEFKKSKARISILSMKKTLFSRCSRLYFFDIKFVFMHSEQAVALRIWFEFPWKQYKKRLEKFSTWSKKQEIMPPFFWNYLSTFITNNRVLLLILIVS